MIEDTKCFHSFMSDVSIIVRLLRTNAERSMAHLNIGFPEQMVLMVLSSGKPMIQNDIAQILGVDKGAIARTITKLEEKGYISRCSNPDNRRENKVQITPKCDAMMEEMRENLLKVQERAFDGFSNEERQTIENDIHRLAANLNSLNED